MVDPRREYKNKVSSRNTRVTNYNNRARSYERISTVEPVTQQVPLVQTINNQIQSRGRIISHQIKQTKKIISGTTQTYAKIAIIRAGETLKHVIACNKQDNNGTYGYSGADSASAAYISLAYGYSDIDDLIEGELIDQKEDIYHLLVGRGIEAGNSVDLINIIGRDVEGIERHRSIAIEYTFDKDTFLYLRNHSTPMVDITIIIK